VPEGSGSGTTGVTNTAGVRAPAPPPPVPDEWLVSTKWSVSTRIKERRDFLRLSCGACVTGPSSGHPRGWPVGGH
jgi:hypothetical protein